MAAGDFVLIARGEPHILSSGHRTKPFPLLELDRRSAHLGVVRGALALLASPAAPADRKAAPGVYRRRMK
jgi:hypothetical protein